MYSDLLRSFSWWWRWGVVLVVGRGFRRPPSRSRERRRLVGAAVVWLWWLVGLGVGVVEPQKYTCRRMAVVAAERWW